MHEIVPQETSIAISGRVRVPLKGEFIQEWNASTQQLQHPAECGGLGVREIF